MRGSARVQCALMLHSAHTRQLSVIIMIRDVPVTLFLPVTVTGGIVTIPAGTGTGILGHVTTRANI
jgi:hypothetical protein